MSKQPMQPVHIDSSGRARFVENANVRFLLDEASAGRKCDLNDLTKRDFPQEDWEQFAQLIGYSVAGYGTLSYVSDRTYAMACRRADKLLRAAEMASCGPVNVDGDGAEVP